MLTIRPIEDKKLQEDYCALCGIEYLADALAYSCFEGEKFIGVCQFMLKSGCVYLYHLATAADIDDFGAKFIMGRAALNFADLSGFSDAYYVSPDDEKLAKMVGFKKDDDGNWYFNLRGFFESPCSCDNH